MKISCDFEKTFPKKKSESDLCGKACLSVIADYFGIDSGSFEHERSVWIPDLVLDLFNNHLRTRLFCSMNSKLYADYRTAKNKAAFEGFRAVGRYEQSVGNVTMLDFGISEIDAFLANGILLTIVDSATWNQDSMLRGGHYIVVLDSTENCYVVANPKRKEVVLQLVDKTLLSQCLAVAGGWVAVVSSETAYR